jgi:hypothetical protein
MHQVFAMPLISIAPSSAASACRPGRSATEHKLLMSGAQRLNVALAKRSHRSKSATASTWLDHRNWSIGVTLFSL